MRGATSPAAQGTSGLCAGTERRSRGFVFVPGVLIDVSTVSTETTVLGSPVSMPALVAPMAFQAIAHEDHELAMAEGTAAAGTLMCLSTVATATPSDVAAAAPGRPALAADLRVPRPRGQ